MALVVNKHEKYMLQSMAAKLLPRERVARCLRYPIAKGAQAVVVEFVPAFGSAHFANLVTCGSVWHCPICASKISERRRVELQPVVDSWPERGGSVLLLTLTMRHTKKEPLKFVLAGLTGATDKLRSGEWWQNFVKRHAILGLVRSLELTHGKNGWHPHTHYLIFTSKTVDLYELLHAIRLRWRHVLIQAGRSASYERGADIRYVDGKVPSYMTKLGLTFSHEDDIIEDKPASDFWTATHELVKSTFKTGHEGSRSPIELLRDSMAGDGQAAKLWQEYGVVLKGHKHLVYSRGFKNFLGITDKKDSELVRESHKNEALTMIDFSPTQWQEIINQGLRGLLLDVASMGDIEALKAFLNEYNLN